MRRSERRDKFIKIRCGEEEKVNFEEFAKGIGLDMSSFFRLAALDAMKNGIKLPKLVAPTSEGIKGLLTTN